MDSKEEKKIIFDMLGSKSVWGICADSSGQMESGGEGRGGKPKSIEED